MCVFSDVRSIDGESLKKHGWMEHRPMVAQCWEIHDPSMDPWYMNTDL